MSPPLKKTALQTQCFIKNYLLTVFCKRGSSNSNKITFCPFPNNRQPETNAKRYSGVNFKNFDHRYLRDKEIRNKMSMISTQCKQMIIKNALMRCLCRNVTLIETSMVNLIKFFAFFERNIQGGYYPWVY